MKFTLMICDDESIYREELKKGLKEIMGNYQIQPIIVEASDGFDVLTYLDKESIDVLFMDIEMIQLNGIDTAKEIRKRDSEMLIVFVTAHESFAVQSYEVQAFDYMLKNKMQQLPQKYDRIMKTIQERVKAQEQSILVGSKNELIKVFLSDIYYLEVEGHRTIIHTGTGQIHHNEKISVMEKKLSENNFVRCHNSFLVNLDKVIGIIPKEGINYFELENDLTVEISRRKKKEVMDTFFNFIRRH